MATTTYTPNLRFTLQPDGANPTTWGDITNEVFNLTDTAITGMVSIDMTGNTNYTLSVANGLQDEARNACLYLYGTPTSTPSLIIPAALKSYLVIPNMSSGNVTIKTAAGTGQTFSPNNEGIIYCDGVSVWPIATLGVTHNDVTSALASYLTSASAVTGFASRSFGAVSASNTLVCASGLNQTLNLRGSSSIQTSASGNTITFKVTPSGTVTFATTVQVQTGTATSVAIDPLGLKTAIGYSNFYTSPEQTISGGSGITLSHGLGSIPKHVSISLRCKTAEFNHAVGDEIEITGGRFFDGSPSSGQTSGWQVSKNSTSVYITTGNNGPDIYDRITGAAQAITLSNWKYVVRAWA